MVVAANFALGAVMMMHLSKIAARYFDYAEIIEEHHEKKIDAPSGTSLMTAEMMAQARGKPFIHPPSADSRGKEVEGIAIHSVRLPGILARQEVIFGCPGADTLYKARYRQPGVLYAGGNDSRQGSCKAKGIDIRAGQPAWITGGLNEGLQGSYRRRHRHGRAGIYKSASAAQLSRGKHKTAGFRTVSAGKKLFYNHDEIEVEETSPESFKGIDIALFSAGADISRYFSPIAAQSGAVVVDNSAAFRMDPKVPLVVPEVNPEDIKKHKGIIANPNCSTIQMVVALYPLHKVNPIKRIVVSTYQAVSGTGVAAVDELTLQSKNILNGQEVVPHVYPHQIAYNILPEIDVFLDNAYTKEEWKMVEETRKIMHADGIAISATCARVPVFIGHSEAVNIELTNMMSPEDARRVLSQSPGIKLLDDPTISLYPQPWSAAGTDEVYVGRIRRDSSHEKGLVMWIVSDNIRNRGCPECRPDCRRDDSQGLAQGGRLR